MNKQTEYWKQLHMMAEFLWVNKGTKNKQLYLLMKEKYEVLINQSIPVETEQKFLSDEKIEEMCLAKEIEFKKGYKSDGIEDDSFWDSVSYRLGLTEMRDLIRDNYLPKQIDIEKLLTKLFDKLQKEAYDKRYHFYDYKKTNQIIREFVIGLSKN